MQTSALFDAKNFEIYGASARTRGEKVERVRHFADKEDGSIFRVFVRTSFMDNPLRKKRIVL